MSTWTAPAYDEVRMDAEIGSYQPEDERDEPPFARAAAEGAPDAA